MNAVGQAAIPGWALVGALVLILVGERRRATRKRDALNRALHELRRPLQLLSFGSGARRLAPTTSPLELAIAALGQLDREINGGPSEPRHAVTIRAIADAAVGRWGHRANHAGGSIVLRWRAGDAAVIADPSRIAQALDNLIANAIEHGGPNVVVDARASGSRLRISVLDDGRSSDRVLEVDRRSGAWLRTNARNRHGHGLEVVRSVAAAHRGRFALQRSEQGSVAMLELPLAGSGAALAA